MKADDLEESLLYELEERLLQPDIRKSAKDVMDLYHFTKYLIQMIGL